MRVLITGATGAVGRPLVRALLRGGRHDLVILARDPRKLGHALCHHPRITVIEGDLTRTDALAPQLAGVEAAVLVATAWGGPDAGEVICGANLALARAVATAGGRHVLYFATASVLARDGHLLPEARSLGTDYIRAKAALVAGMEAMASPRLLVTGLFPTLVFAGRPTMRGAPDSHLVRLLRQVAGRIGLVRFLSAPGRLHMIHAEDIATVVAHLLETPPGDNPARLILGNPAASLDDLVSEASVHLGRVRRRLVRVTPGLAAAVIALFRIRLSPWDRWCMAHPDQSYDGAVNPAAFGLPVAMPTFAAGLASAGIGPAAPLSPDRPEPPR